jgi:hypothetical protein
VKKLIVLMLVAVLPCSAKADFWGADLPLLVEIVANTLHTMMELQEQTSLMSDAYAGINDRINRVRTISDLVQPASWDQWKDPATALRRMQTIYKTLPKEYRSEKSDAVEKELAEAMNLLGRLEHETKTTFDSGKELERRGADASPAVAQKLTASGVGTLISLESQSQAMQSHIVALLSQILAEGNERENRTVIARGSAFGSFATSLGNRESVFSKIVLSKGSVTN